MGVGVYLNTSRSKLVGLDLRDGLLLRQVDYLDGVGADQARACHHPRPFQTPPLDRGVPSPGILGSGIFSSLVPIIEAGTTLVELPHLDEGLLLELGNQL